MRPLMIVLVSVLASCGGAKAPSGSASTPRPIENVAPSTEIPSEVSITGIEPERGDAEGGTYVRIRGARFLADGPRNAKVYFGSRQGTVVRFASDAELIVEAPGGMVGETVDILVIFDPGGERKLPASFTFVDKR